MRANFVRGLLVALILTAALPVLTACNTTAGAGQDISNTGAAINRGANDVKRGM